MKDERGSISLFAVVIATALFAAAGLVIDGAAGIRDASRASDIAEEAARAGAIAGETPGSGGLVGLDVIRARDAAANWLADAGVNPADAEITAGTDVVTVLVHLRRQTTLLRLAGVSELNVEGTGSARPATGITKEGS
jgi:Flp pilus assembly protein TadG